MPAAAVIPAPIVYIKVVAVKKLVVELLAVCSYGSYQAALLPSVCKPYATFSGLVGGVDILL